MGTEQEKSTLQVRLIRRVTFYGRIEVPLPGFFFGLQKRGINRMSDRLIKLANRVFGLSTDAFVKSVKKFLDKGVRTILPLNSRWRSPPYPSHLLCFISRCLVSPRSIYILGIDCQTTLQVLEKLISRLPVEIYVQLRLLLWPDTGQYRRLKILIFK